MKSENVLAVVGLGAAAVIGYLIYKHYQSQLTITNRGITGQLNIGQLATTAEQLASGIGTTLGNIFGGSGTSYSGGQTYADDPALDAYIDDPNSDFYA